MWVWELLGSASGYGTGTVLTARFVYGRRRTAFFAGVGERRLSPEATVVFERQERTQSELVALLTGLAWIVTVPLLGLRHAIAIAVFSRPPVTPYERELRRQALHARIDELESSLGMDLGP